MLEQTTLEVIAVNDHRKCYRSDHTTVIIIMPLNEVGIFYCHLLPEKGLCVKMNCSKKYAQVQKGGNDDS